ncbi:hypothetical protein HCN44_006175 [Aphidius gifuensis]|uniref:Uncharacterized protein n=1 Tax=Aphidius gifuensis TaxID=684658 RepID=A0A835CV16_APHGI|nr:probable serine/threonine-protein kinase DDB_G0282963 isoform X2 [Aphidius gifuensis]KAF7997604.1 hypothetical protein HCN44_006175 [Aphidius gifuensis]
MSCRKKIDSKIWLDYVTMETEVQNLKKELNHTRNDLKISKKKCHELIKNLDNQKIYHQSEYNLRDKQLTKILRALLVLESRLRQEQKTIRQQLIEKDNTIRTQQMEISRLRRQTKNYIKINNRENNNNNNINIINPGDLNNVKESDNCNYINDIGITGLNNNNLRNHINRLKLELVNKIGSYDNVNNNNYEFGVKKTDSFAGSDVSKESIGSENTDASILTTTTEGSLSVLSTEGFCEGESTDVSPGSTLNKSSRYKNLNIETDMCIKILDCHDNNNDDDDVDKYSKRRLGVSRTEPMEIFNNQICKISRSDSKDDGMDCNFISGEEEDDDDDGEEKEDNNAEPIYVNACSNDNNSTKNIDDNDVKILNDKQFNSNNNEDKNNNKNRSLQPQDKSIEETSGNWYSDPDEDRISEEFSRHNTYRTNSKHNSVLECVNQILLRDMEDEENIQSVSKKFKHRGRIVSFQPARLSDIESVGSEMERRNSEEVNNDKESQNFESNNSEDDYIIINNNNNNNLSSTITSSECIDSESGIDEEIIDNNGLARAIPIVIIEPDINDINRKLSSSPNLSIKTCNSSNNNSLIRLESIEEKTCLSMSTKNLTIAKNLDYEDIESLPDLTLKTPPALPPKPKFRTNTLILKKIPSPSFFIDENKNKNSPNRDTYIRNYYKTNKQINKTTGTTTARSLVFRKKSLNDIDNINYDILNKNNSNNDLSLIPRVGNIVRHFEEFKIGSDTDIRINKTKDHKIIQKIDEIDIRQNFEEFNFDDCDLSDDPDRLDGDGSDKLVNNIINNDTSTSSTPSSPSSPTKTTINNNDDNNNHSSGIYDHFLEATGLSTKSILTPSRLISNHRDMLKPKDIKYKNKIKSNTINDKNNCSTTSGTSSSSSSQTHVKHWTGPFV